MDYSRIDEYESPFQPPARPPEEYERLLTAFAVDELPAAEIRAALAFRDGRAPRAKAGALPRPLEETAAAAAQVFAGIKSTREQRDKEEPKALRAALLTALGVERLLDAAWLVHLRAPAKAWPVDEHALRAMRFSRIDRPVKQLEFDDEVSLVADETTGWANIDDYQRWAESQHGPRKFHSRLQLYCFWSSFGRKLREDVRLKLGYHDNPRIFQGLSRGFELRHPALAAREIRTAGGETFEVRGSSRLGYLLGHGERRAFVPAADVRDLLESTGGKTLSMGELTDWMTKRLAKRPLVDELAAALVADGIANQQPDGRLEML